MFNQLSKADVELLLQLGDVDVEHFYETVSKNTASTKAQATTAVQEADAGVLEANADYETAVKIATATRDRVLDTWKTVKAQGTKLLTDVSKAEKLLARLGGSHE